VDKAQVTLLNSITQFTGRWWILSNYAYCDIVVDGERYQSVEHYFQAMKARDPGDRERIRVAESPDDAKRLGKSVPRIANWTDRRIDFMRRGLRAKFSISNPPGQALLATGIAFLAEGNDWGDDEWGIVDGVGLNLLGILLMEHRGALRLEAENGHGSADC
jgi:ribA/ribD-fused uncharacterized protein